MSYLGNPNRASKWGEIGGTLSDQTDLQAALDAKLSVSQLVGHRNKLINGKFRVNQRGYVSGTATTGANQYTLDRWRVVTSGQSVTFTASGSGNIVTAPAGGYEEVIEGANIEGGIYTLSWIGTATATVNGAAITNGGQTASLTANTNVTIRFSSGTVSEAQFEAGTIKTPFDHRQIGDELALCQRYCLVLGGDSVSQTFGWGQAIATNAAHINIPLLRMRTSPTFSSSGSFAASTSNGALSGVSSFAFGGTTSGSSLALLVATMASAALVVGDATRLTASSDLNARLIFDAEL